MSSTNRGKERELDDHYATPPDIARLVCEKLREDFLQGPGHILEPGCGGGVFLDAIQETWPDAERAGIEINPNLAQLAEDNGHEVHNYNALLYPLKSGGPDGKWDAIITNPPFIHAEDWITTFLPRLAPDGIMALLLRLNFLGSQGRWERLWQHEAYRPSHMYVMPARVGFTTDGGTDSIEYMIAVWRPDPPEAMTWSFLNNLDTDFRWTGPHPKYHPEASP